MIHLSKRLHGADLGGLDRYEAYCGKICQAGDIRGATGGVAQRQVTCVECLVRFGYTLCDAQAQAVALALHRGGT